MSAPDAPVRVRFAPSPTGYLHIGGARTALFNWLYARHHGGTFVLRIEDTDQERSTVESERAILESMKWLGLDWDEGPEVGGDYGPYTQMERLALYREYADKLIEAGKAYRCYATREELDVLRKEAEKQKKQFFYPHLWRDKTEKDWLPGKPYVVRFKTPLAGETSFEDEVFKRIVTPNAEIQDFVLMRSDGVPLYNFGAFVDDVTMKITLVARGRDHVVNTPQQVLLYQAMGLPLPRFAHLPMMLAPDGKKLSKREAERYDIPVSVTAYRDRGFSADGLLNYLVRFGWSHGDKETFSRKEMTELFDFAGASRADGKFDMKKCVAINHKIIKDDAYTPLARVADEIKPLLAARGLAPKDDGQLSRALVTVRERARTYVEIADALDYYFRDVPVMDEAAKTKFLVPDAAPLLLDLAATVAAVEPFETKAIEEKVHAHLAEKGLEIKVVAQPARVALTGRSASPGLYEVMDVLGKAATVARLEAAAKVAQEAKPALDVLAELGPSLFPVAKAAVNPPNSPLHTLLAHPVFKAGLPVPVLFLLAPIVWWFFHRTWYQLDREAQLERGALLAEGQIDRRPAVAFVIAAVVLTLQEYYGGRGTFEELIRPFLAKRIADGWTWIRLDKYASLWSYGWWAAARVIGYVLIPLPLWKLLFPKDSLLDMGLRTRGFLRHVWIYLLCLAVVIPAMLIVARQPDFGTYYPFYKDASRSWFDLCTWEVMYFVQFLSLEIFFRGFWLATMRRSLGSGAIFAMAVPYCMIHYGKPYLEANGAIIAGIVLGSLSMRTRSIYAGFLVHITVALAMDLLALSHRGALPKVLFAP